MSNARSVLIVDPDPVTLNAISGIVSQERVWKILEARNAIEAKTAAERSQPDIILVNNKVPQLNGVQVTQTILEAASDSRVLFLSDNNSMIHSAFGSGVLGYLLRAQVEPDLLPAIDQILLGRTFFTAEAIRLIRVRQHRNPFPGEHKDLSPREITILQEVASGASSREVADTLKLSIRTVDAHRAAIMEKLGLKNLSDLVRYAIRAGFIEA